MEQGQTAYTSNLGMLSLRKEICKYVYNNYHVKYNPENECLVTIGVSEALDVAMRALLNPGDEVIYTAPCFVSYPAEIVMAHGVPVPVPTYEKDEFALTPETLRSVITPRSKVLLLNFPCNPTGAVMSLENLKAVAAIAEEYDLAVITDEIYSELIYDNWQHHSIAALDGMRERTVFLHGFSKAFAMTGWRLGYACGPAPVMKVMIQLHQYGLMCAPTTAQYAAIEAMNNGDEDVEKMRGEYDMRRRYIVDELNKLGLTCFEPEGAFYVFPSIQSTGMTSEELCQRLLKEKHVAVVPGNAFGDSGEGFIRISYCYSIKHITEAIKRMRAFLEENGLCK